MASTIGQSVYSPNVRSARDAGAASAQLAPSRLMQTAIEHAVVQVFGVTPDELRMDRRGEARIALARQAAMYLAHVTCGFTYTDVGRLFGRDRTTVAHACEVIEDRRDDSAFDRTLDLLEWAVPVIASREEAF